MGCQSIVANNIGFTILIHPILEHWRKWLRNHLAWCGFK